MTIREQKPPFGKVLQIEVTRAPYPDQEPVTIRYKRESEGWYVKTPEYDRFQLFAHKDARDRDVRQLINKKWCYRYGDPDPLSDR